MVRHRKGGVLMSTGKLDVETVYLTFEDREVGWLVVWIIATTMAVKFVVVFADHLSLVIPKKASDDIVRLLQPLLTWELRPFPWTSRNYYTRGIAFAESTKAIQAAASIKERLFHSLLYLTFDDGRAVIYLEDCWLEDAVRIADPFGPFEVI
jgi:hypothetical protein